MFQLPQESRIIKVWTLSSKIECPLKTFDSLKYFIGLQITIRFVDHKNDKVSHIQTLLLRPQIQSEHSET